MLNTARRMVATARRRGAAYFGSFRATSVWPRVAYRYGWGPAAPAVLQGAFAAAGELAAEKADPETLIRLRLLARPGEAVPAPDATADELERLMTRAHAAGITGIAASFRSVVRSADGALLFSDLGSARKHRLESMHFSASRDADRRSFNRQFGANLLTEAGARHALEELRARLPQGSADDAHLELGDLTGAQPGSRHNGPRHWEVFTRDVVAPIVEGQRVLDLGANKGLLPLLMLRAGARTVVTIEDSQAAADFARLSARILAWRDMRPYDIQVLTGDMRLFLADDLGPFDVVTAFGSLHRVSEEDTARVIRKAASLGAVLVLQANEAIEDLAGRTLELHRLMRENGYAQVAVHSSPGLSRPLLVGRSETMWGPHTRAPGA